MRKDLPPTNKQLNFLLHLGYSGSMPETRKAASAEIGWLLAKKRQAENPYPTEKANKYGHCSTEKKSDRRWQDKVADEYMEMSLDERINAANT